MSKAIKPQQGVVYECYKGYKDAGMDRVRIGQKFVWDGDDNGSQYVFDKASGKGVSVFVPKDKFASYFCPAADQSETKPKPKSESKFKVGDKVKIANDSEWYEPGNKFNPIDTVGEITQISKGYLGINVEWDDEITNSYNECDLVLAKQESYIDVTEKIKNMTIQAITVSSTEQIKELAKVSFLKDQIESAFPHLFVTHKVGNRYKHEDGNRYILTGENSHVALTNLRTGMVESHTIRTNSFDNITVDEFKQLCLDTDKLTLIKERQ